MYADVSRALVDPNHAGIPREMRAGSWRLAIAGAKHLPDKPYAPIANAHLTIESNDTFGEAAVKALFGIPTRYAERIAADAAGFIKAGDHLTALLTLLEYEMTTSKPLPAEMMERARAVVAAPDVRALQGTGHAGPHPRPNGS